jgi:acetyl coenzyme A synthetase (ADP forming)-like protein
MADASIDPYAADIVLRDGSTLRLREARPADEDDLRAFHEGLSPASLYSRFFAVPKTAGPEVARLLRADPVDDVVLVGQTAGHIVAVGTLSRDRRARDRAEVAFAIADAVQGRGVGTRLLEYLAEIARRRDIAFFDAFVLADNLAMMRVFEDSGLMLERHVDGEVHRIVLGVAPTARSRDSAAQRAVVAATASIAAVVRPDSVAVIGANRTRGKIGSELLHNIIAGGYTGRLAVVHPTAAAIDGVTAYRSVGDIPGTVDLAVIAVPAAQVLAVMDACIAKGVKAAVVISAGFSEVGGDGRAREAALLQRVREAGIRLVGPNCMGIINTDPAVRLNATFAPIAPRAGHVALSTQSGALGFAILDYARQLNIGFSTFVSVGNKADVSGNDLVQYWARDPGTDVILLYLESFGNPRKFSQIARRVSRTKPIAAVKAGRSSAGSRAAASHTGALAASDAIVDALFRQTGVIRTDTLEELFDVAALIANQPIPRGRRVAILTNAGGPGILAADTCEARGLQLPALGDDTVAALRRLLPPTAAVGNPVDMIASATAAHYEGALTALLDDDRIDGVLVIFIPPLVTTAEDAAGAIQRAANARPGKPVLAVCMSTAPTPATLTTVPNYRFPESAAIALARAANYGEWRLRPEGTIPSFLDLDRPAARLIVHHQLDRGGGWLPPGEAEALLRAVGLPVARSGVAATEDAARAEAERIGFPVAVKAVGPDILHKADVGGLALDLRSADAVRDAWRDLHHRLGSRLTGVLVQQMVQGGVEMLVGVIDDPAFGHVIACATGGTLTEILADRQLALHPLTDLDARDLVAGLRGVALLRGYRGSAPADEPALITALLRLSALVDCCPEIRELDINPLVVLTSGVCALDVRIRIEPPRPATPTRRVSYG